MFDPGIIIGRRLDRDEREKVIQGIRVFLQTQGPVLVEVLLQELARLLHLVREAAQLVRRDGRRAAVDDVEVVGLERGEVLLVLLLALGGEVLVGEEDHVAGVVEDPVAEYERGGVSCLLAL